MEKLNKTDLMQLGEKIQQTRKEKKITLENIADQTKINIEFLKSMEQGRFDFLPDLYVRNFLKLYVRQLGQDSSAFLDEYDEIVHKDEPKIQTVTDEELKNFKPPKQLRSQISNIIEKIKPYIRQMNVLWLILGAIIVVLVVYSLVQNQDNQQIIRAGTTGTSLVEIKNNPVAAPQVVKQDFFRRGQDLNLELTAVERTWLTISIDDSSAREHVFDYGMKYTWQAKERFNLLIGNGSGIRLSLNGKDLGPLGDPGEVVRIDVTEDGVRNNSL
jgi:transcriptional regulator with XRE-family HTH domain